MKTALFTNFSNEDFIGYWNGKPYKFKAGEGKYFEEGIAQHFAKHLVNRELLKLGKERATSPKFPEQVPDFMELFNKAFILEKSDEEQDEAQAQTVAINKNKEVGSDIEVKDKVQIVIPPNEDEEEFEGKPKE